MARRFAASTHRVHRGGTARCRALLPGEGAARTLAAMSADHDDSLAAPAPGPLFVLETEQRLSRSRIWEAQRAYFHKHGIAAWQSGAVPHYVTNNPALAAAAADVVLGFLRDRRAAGSLDPAEPVHIVELGAGAGRFGYVFLRAFSEALRRSSLRDIPFRYVMTDFTDSNIDFFGAHPALAPFAQLGVLDFAQLDAERDREIRLRRAQVTLSPGALRNPLVVLANYVFDGLPQDAFYIHEERLHERLVTVASPRPQIDAHAAEPFADLIFDYHLRQADLDYYPDREFNAVLQGYVRAFREATLLFPCAALGCVNRLADLARGQLLLLSADRDDGENTFRRDVNDLGMAVHGSISLPVNHRAIGDYVRARGGRVLRASHEHSHLNMVAFALGALPAGPSELDLACERAFVGAGPDDFFNLKYGIHAVRDQLAIPHILSLLRISHHDPGLLRDYVPTLARLVEGASPTHQKEVVRTVKRAWENHFHIGEPRDLGFELGELFYAAGDYGEAAAMFEESLTLHGDSPATRWNLALCHAAMRRPQDAIKEFAAAMDLDPSFLPAGALQHKRLGP